MFCLERSCLLNLQWLLKTLRLSREFGLVVDTSWVSTMLACKPLVILNTNWVRELWPPPSYSRDSSVFLCFSYDLNPHRLKPSNLEVWLAAWNRNLDRILSGRVFFGPWPLWFSFYCWNSIWSKSMLFFRLLSNSRFSMNSGSRLLALPESSLGGSEFYCYFCVRGLEPGFVVSVGL